MVLLTFKSIGLVLCSCLARHVRGVISIGADAPHGWCSCLAPFVQVAP